MVPSMNAIQTVEPERPLVDLEELLNADEAAKLLRQKPQTLAAWRCEKRGPAYVKVGRSVFYQRSAISAWLTSQIVRPTTGQGRA